MTQPACRVGFIGLGLMGHALASNSARAGHAVSLLIRNDKDRNTAAALLAQGGQEASTPAALLEQVDTVVICVSATPQVEDVVFGASGLLSGPIAGRTVIDCSTSIPESSLRIAAALRAQGAEFVDAAMTGTPRDAEAGAINLLLGGAPQVLARLEGLMHCWARNLYHCGDTGTGHSVKLLHQFVVLSNAAVLAEAYSLARKTGVNLNVLGEVIASGGANSTAFQRLRPYVEEGNDEMFRFSLGNALKDMRYYRSMNEAANAQGALSEATISAYTSASEQGLEALFVPHLLDAMDRLNGLAPPDRI
ncbi:NAD(P)-dependent oxidoreductase [Hydrogenophaga palleronii]|uniref:NAD(P)-dependent oxidoreductase n=1 Tax=Hydrogenophaga palleronii TaxID=65655 RepID=UPI000826D48A|nr:NAD(P)-dependent oxidoreductase [Hydrogenophaga palleronii]